VPHMRSEDRRYVNHHLLKAYRRLGITVGTYFGGNTVNQAAQNKSEGGTCLVSALQRSIHTGDLQLFINIRNLIVLVGSQAQMRYYFNLSK
jgi:hypothetical protein